jgi:hypothetical protein
MFLCRVRPDGYQLYDGTTLNPFEVVFVPRTAYQTDSFAVLRNAAKYAEWSSVSSVPLIEMRMTCAPCQARITLQVHDVCSLSGPHHFAST